MRATLIISLMLMSLGARAQEKPVLYLGGHAHLGTGKAIEKSAIVVENGKFTQVANALLVKIDSSAYDTIIDLKGKHVYPAFIAPNSTLGLTEIDAVRATRDFQEVGLFKPHIRSIIAYNTDSEVTPTVRSNGVLIGQITPRGGRVTGTSSVVLFDGNNWEDAVYKMDDGVHVNWPRMYKRSGWWAEPGTIQKQSKYDEQLKALYDFVREAQAYSSVKEHEERDLRLEAMRGIFDGSKTLFVHADYVKELVEIIQFKREFQLENLVLVGAYDAWLITDMIKLNKVPIMLKRVHSLPERPEDDIDLPYKLPKLLHDAGISFCLENSGDMEAMGARNLPFFAGTAVAYGLDYETAVGAITLETAKILGVDDRTGSLEKGKDANFFISSGDALDMETNHVEAAYLKGKPINLSNRQLELYKKYMGIYDLPLPEKHQD